MVKPVIRTRRKERQFIDTNVYDEAIKRINHIYDVFDTVVVMFSGGKDSLAVLHLVKEVADSRKITAPINVVFRDEELINDVVIEFVNKYRKLDWVDMKYFAVPLYSQKYVLGKTDTYVQWDKTRKHIRPIPEHAIKTKDDDPKIYSQNTMDDYTASFYTGKIAFINGIRAAESITRYGACMSKVNENYINAPKSNVPNVRLCKPIFDWQENDVFKYFYDNKIKYCNIYDWQMWNEEQLRVATPIHAENAKRFHKLKTLDPMLYEQVIDIFPDMIVQERYYKDFDKQGIKKKYSKDLQSVLQYIKDFITDPKQKHEAYKMFPKVVAAHRNDPNAYPIHHLLTYFSTGIYKRNIQPLFHGRSDNE